MLCGWIAFPGSPHAVVDICLTDDVSRETAAAPTPSRRGLAGSPSAGVDHDAAGVTPQRTVVGRTSCGERAHRQRRARPPYLVPRSHEPARPPSAVRKLAIPLRRIPAPVPALDHIAPVWSRISAGHATPARPARSVERFPFHVERDQLRLPENARAAACHLPMQPRRAVGQSRVRRGTHPCTAPVHPLCITARCPQTAPKGGSRPPSPWQPSVPNALACGRPRPVFSASALSSRATSSTRETDRRSVTRVIAMETRMSTGSPQDVDKPAVDKAFTTTLRHAPSHAARSSTQTAHRRPRYPVHPEPQIQPEHHQAATQDPRLSTVPPADDAASSARPRAQRARRHRPPRSQHPVPPTRKGARTPTRTGSPRATSWPIGLSSLATFSCPRSVCATRPPSRTARSWAAHSSRRAHLGPRAPTRATCDRSARRSQLGRTNAAIPLVDRIRLARGLRPPCVRSAPDSPAHGTLTGRPSSRQRFT